MIKKIKKKKKKSANFFFHHRIINNILKLFFSKYSYTFTNYILKKILFGPQSFMQLINLINLIIYST